MGTRESTFPRVAYCAAALLLLLIAALALVACGSSGSAPTAAPSTPTPTASPSPVATPTTTAEVTAAYFAALSHVDNDIYAFRRLVGLYAEDAGFEDRSMGTVAVGRKAIADNIDAFFLAGPLKAAPFSRLVGSEWAVIEEVDSAGGGQVYAVNVLQVRGGKIMKAYVYYNDTGSDDLKFRPAPLTTSPAASDTEAAGQAMAADYMSALRALEPARLSPLYAGDVVYQDIARDHLYVGPRAAIAAHARMYALRGISFQKVGAAAGPGWAAVMWKRTDREGGKPLVDIPARYTRWAKRPTIHGVTILEVRDGKIGRETIYSDHLRTRY
jgi:hypothetical protein